MELIKTFKNDKISVFFNGGKDSIVLLNLIKQVFDLSTPIIFILKQNEFPEILEYVDQICKDYKLNIMVFSSMKEAIKTLTQEHNITHAFTGIRSIDPYGNKTSLVQKTDSDWPQITLVNPLLNWSYGEIWSYILDNNLPYCKLYDEGYTSLGQTNNTFKNHLLFDLTNKKYLPAYCLQDNTNERIGRINCTLPLTLKGPVIHGNKRGKELGFPTANILENEIQLDDGIYYGTLKFNGELKKFVMSYGKNVHFNNKNTTLEIHILDLKTEDFYGKELKFTISGFIRKMDKFTNIEELVNSINRDIIIAKYNLENL